MVELISKISGDVSHCWSMQDWHLFQEMFLYALAEYPTIFVAIRMLSVTIAFLETVGCRRPTFIYRDSARPLCRFTFLQH